MNRGGGFEGDVEKENIAYSGYERQLSKKSSCFFIAC